jgi:excisionase family DNA binding protein
MENKSPVLTVHEASTLLRVCPQTIYAMARNGTLPTLRLGRRTLIVRSGLNAMLEAAVAKSIAA